MGTNGNFNLEDFMDSPIEDLLDKSAFVLMIHNNSLSKMQFDNILTVPLFNGRQGAQIKTWFRVIRPTSKFLENYYFNQLGPQRRMRTQKGCSTSIFGSC